MKKEATLIDNLNKYLKQAYGDKTFAYHTHSAGYGESGFPDLVIFHRGHMLLAECKRDVSPQAALSHLRPSQKGMFAKIGYTGVPVYLLYDGGLIEYKNGKWNVYIDSSQFSSLSSILDTL